MSSLAKHFTLTEWAAWVESLLNGDFDSSEMYDLLRRGLDKYRARQLIEHWPEQCAAPLNAVFGLAALDASEPSHSVVQFLLQLKGDASGHRPLISCAVWRRRADLVGLLVEARADVRHQIVHGICPVWIWAAHQGDAGCLTELARHPDMIAAGVDADVFYDSDAGVCTALGAAVVHRKPETVRLLLAWRANPHLIPEKAWSSTYIKRGKTPMTLACQFDESRDTVHPDRQPAVMQVLVQAGAIDLFSLGGVDTCFAHVHLLASRIAENAAWNSLNMMVDEMERQVACLTHVVEPHLHRDPTKILRQYLFVHPFAEATSNFGSLSYRSLETFFTETRSARHLLPDVC